MPSVFVKFFEEAREFTDEQIAELKAGHLLRESPPIPAFSKLGAPAAQAPPAPPAAGGQVPTVPKPGEQAPAK